MDKYNFAGWESEALVRDEWKQKMIYAFDLPTNNRGCTINNVKGWEYTMLRSMSITSCDKKENVIESAIMSLKF